MPWNFMQVTLTPTGRIEPVIGEGRMSRDAALAAIQELLDRGSAIDPPRDDTVYAGTFLWCIYSHPTGEDPTHAAMALLEDFSQRMSDAPAIWSADRPSGQPDPAEVIRRTVAGTVPGRAYPRPLPNELAPWYCYTSDGGHSIAVVITSLLRDDAEDPSPADHLVPIPVKTVLRTGWTARDGWVMCDVPYAPMLGAVTPAGDDEFDDSTVDAASTPELHMVKVGEPYNPRVTSWQDGAAELRLQPQGAEFVLFLAQPAAHEVTAFTNGNAEFALVAADRYLMWCYRFTNPKSRNPAAQSHGIPWSDAPWEYHRQAARHSVAVPGERGASFPLHLVLVDAGTGIVKGLRLVSPPVQFADTLRDAVERQAQVPHDPAAAEQDIKALYNRYTTTHLLPHAVDRFEALRDGTTR